MNPYIRQITISLILVLFFVALGEWIPAGIMFTLAVFLTYRESLYKKMLFEHWEKEQHRQDAIDAMSDPDNKFPYK